MTPPITSPEESTSTFQVQNQDAESCNFQGLAMVTSQNMLLLERSLSSNLTTARFLMSPFPVQNQDAESYNFQVLDRLQQSTAMLKHCLAFILIALVYLLCSDKNPGA